jgi:sialic acid synthase SpsE
MVNAIRITELSAGTVTYDVTPSEEASKIFRRSLYVTADIKAGETFTRNNVRSIRPGFGLPPILLTWVLGRTAVTDLQAGTPLQWKHI